MEGATQAPAAVPVRIPGFEQARAPDGHAAEGEDALNREFLETPHGRCALVVLGSSGPAPPDKPSGAPPRRFVSPIDDDAALDAALAALPVAEQQFVRTLGGFRRRDLIAGRTALHLALDDFARPILGDDRGAPVLPAGWVGSVSHKGPRAAAIVAPAGAGSIGIDLELAAPPRLDIARRILTAREQSRLPALDRGRAVTLRFAIKEAIYKAIDPTLRRYVGFTEVELELEAERCTVTSALPFAIEVAWREHAGHWLATARANPM